MEGEEMEGVEGKDGILSAEDLVRLQQGKGKVEVEGGMELRKTLEWTGAPWEKEEITRRLESWSQPLAGSRVESKTSLSLGNWVPHSQRAVLDRWFGRQFEFMGSMVDGKMELKAEEALYLLECSQLDLLLCGVPVSIEQAYSAVLGTDCSLEEYLVYAKLVKLGYRVVRHQGELGITEYEKQVGLDQYLKKDKNVSNQFTPLEGSCIFTGKNVTAPVWLQELREKANPAMYDHYPKEEGYAPAYKSTEAYRVVDQLLDELLDNLHKDDQETKNDEDDAKVLPDRKRKCSQSEKGNRRKIRKEDSEFRTGPESPKYEVDKDDFNSKSGVCYRCLKTHRGGADSCYARDRWCKHCNILGHYDTIHFVENSAARKFILEHLINPDTKRHFREEEIWPSSPPPPEVIDLPDDDGDDELVTSDDDEYTLSPTKLYLNPVYEGSSDESCDEDKSCDNVTSDVIDLLSGDEHESLDAADPAVVEADLAVIDADVTEIEAPIPINGPMARIEALQSAVIQVNQQELMDLSKSLENSSTPAKLPTGSERGTKTQLYCSLCHVESGSVINHRVHLNGKPHLKKLQVLAGRTKFFGGTETNPSEPAPATPKGFKLVEASARRGKPEGKKHVYKSKEMLLNLIPNSYQQQRMIIKVMSDYIPKSCRLPMRKDNQRFVNTERLEVDKDGSDADLLFNADISENGHNVITDNSDKVAEMTPEGRASGNPLKQSGGDPKHRTGGKFDCEVCNLQLGSAVSYIAHLQSGRHSKRWKLKQQNDSAAKNEEVDCEVITVVDDEKPKRRPKVQQPCRGFWSPYERVTPLATSRGKVEVIYNFGHHADPKGNVKGSKVASKGRRRFKDLRNWQQHNTAWEPVATKASDLNSVDVEALMIRAASFAKNKISETLDTSGKNSSISLEERTDNRYPENTYPVNTYPSRDSKQIARPSHFNVQNEETTARSSNGETKVVDIVDISAESDIIVEKEPVPIEDKSSDEVVYLSSDDEKGGTTSENNLNGTSARSASVRSSRSSWSRTSSSRSRRSSSRSRRSSSRSRSSSGSSIDDVSAHPELRLLKQSALGSLWSYEGSVGPLISPEMAESMQAIYNRTHLCPDPRKEFRRATSSPLKVSFDCYKSSATYKKSLRLVPDYRLVVTRFEDPPPDSSQLLRLETSFSDRAPILFAVVNGGTVSFVTLDKIRLPALIEN